MKHHITGTYECGPQYHFSMEPQTCVCIPIEDGIDVFPATQWLDISQVHVATVLGVPINRYRFVYLISAKASTLTNNL